jgi:transketolase
MQILDFQLARKMANCIRFLSIDAIEKASSGHPGMVMGMADVATILFAEFLKFNPQDPDWLDRDRFILSAGHGSMLIYSLLYLTKYRDISIEDIKNFRQLNSKCAGHPEFGHISGIETTTGPLGQGLANAVGFAISEEMAKAKYGKEAVNHKTYCLVGDGCLMEGISQEAISIAGNLALKNLIVLWDNNSISIDGKTSIATCENMKTRFEACNWNVLQIDGHDFDQIRSALTKAQNSDKPILIDCKTTIAFGSPNKAGSEKSHGSPLGKDEIELTRKNLDWNFPAFEIPSELSNQWLKSSQRCINQYQNWQNNFSKIEEGIKSQILRVKNKDLSKEFYEKVDEFEAKIESAKANQATRKSSQNILEFLTANLPEMIGGSADLTSSVLTKTSQTAAIDKNNFNNRYLHYGIREHAMAAIMNALSLDGFFLPYGGTFLVFSDYLKPAIRLSALMKQRVIYIFTHDSIGVGEDGPTHQPIEHLTMLRSIPNLNVFRPCDEMETLICYKTAISAKETPSALILTRQNLPFLSEEKNPDRKKGGYIISKSKKEQPDAIILASGSEVHIAIEAQKKLAVENIDVSVASIYSMEIFDSQSNQYKKSVLKNNDILKVAIEAGVQMSWDKYLGSDGIFIGMKDFGSSGKAEELFKYFKITADEIVERIKQKLCQ